MRFQAIITDCGSAEITALAQAIEQDDILWCMHEEVFEQMCDQTNGNQTSEQYQDYATFALGKLTEGGKIVIDFETDDRDGDDNEVFPTKLMAAVKAMNSQYVYLNEGEDTSRGKVPAFVEASVIGLGDVRARISPSGDGWEALVGTDASDEERGMVSALNDILCRDRWLASEEAPGIRP